INFGSIPDQTGFLNPDRNTSEEIVFLGRRLIISLEMPEGPVVLLVGERLMTFRSSERVIGCKRSLYMFGWM
ncbi:40357_t:CDS:1, partial [Gigaspora margarita]